MNFAFEVIDIVRKEEPDLFDKDLQDDIIRMINEAVECEMVFAGDVLNLGYRHNNSRYARILAVLHDQDCSFNLPSITLKTRLHGTTRLQELTNFFERRVAYQVGVTGEVSFNEDF